jgi:hypothetical protein
MATFSFNLKPNKWMMTLSLLSVASGCILWWLGPSPSWQATSALLLTNIGTIPLLRDYRMRMHWYKNRMETDWADKLIAAMRAENPGLIRFGMPVAPTPASKDLEEAIKEVRD